jgi:hypothetical protein
MNNEKIEQRAAFFRALQAAVLTQMAEARGGTGHKRKPLSAKEQAKRKAKRKQARMSRKQNRKGA